MAHKSSSAARRQRVIGALVGSVVGDALGAPFEFGPPGQFTARFPQSARGVTTEMCGGGGWEPGEWTDDSQMALVLAASLLDNDGLKEADLFDRFAAWVAAGPKDVGIQTRSVLTSRRPWRSAAADHFKAGNRAAGNGSLMRTTPAAIFFARPDADDTEDAARRISALTHGDPAAGDGCTIYHRMVAAALDGLDPFPAMDAALANVPSERRTKWAKVLAPGWTPEQATESNGVVWPTLGTVVWAVRRYTSFEQSMREVIDLGGDTDTVAAVTGGLLGAVHGIQAIPSRWTSAVHGDVPGNKPIASDLIELQALALRLIGDSHPGGNPEEIDPVGPEEVAGLWLANLAGVRNGPPDAVVISLCQTFGTIPQADRRQIYITDNEDNLDLEIVVTDVIQTIEAVREEGRPVLIHCYGGASRTGLILRAWLAKTQGLSPEDAAAQACELWPATGLWNASFTDVLKTWPPQGQSGGIDHATRSAAGR